MHKRSRADTKTGGSENSESCNVTYVCYSSHQLMVGSDLRFRIQAKQVLSRVLGLEAVDSPENRFLFSGTVFGIDGVEGSHRKQLGGIQNDFL